MPWKIRHTTAKSAQACANLITQTKIPPKQTKLLVPYHQNAVKDQRPPRNYLRTTPHTCSRILKSVTCGNADTQQVQCHSTIQTCGSEITGRRTAFPHAFAKKEKTGRKTRKQAPLQEGSLKHLIPHPVAQTPSCQQHDGETPVDTHPRDPRKRDPPRSPASGTWASHRAWRNTWLPACLHATAAAATTTVRAPPTSSSTPPMPPPRTLTSGAPPRRRARPPPRRRARLATAGCRRRVAARGEG